MFDNNKYTTKGVAANIPQYLQNIMWYLIEAMEVSQKDYLQVFELKEVNDDGKILQKVTHTQEQPKYIKAHRLPVHKGITTKIFVIDNGEYSTMLLAEEY